MKLNGRRNIQNVIAVILLLLINVKAQAAVENKRQPVWEAGFAGGALSMPHYMGSDQRYTLPLGLPYLVYRGEFVRVSRRGVKGLLVSKDNFSLDLGLSFGLPVNNNNNARDGMPDLNLTGQAGPRLNWKFSTPEHLPQISLHVPARYVLDTQGKKLGWVTEPSLKIEKKYLGTEKKLFLRMDLGVLFSGKSFNKYYYGVADRFSKSDRPAFEAENGFHSYFAKLSSTYKKSRYLSFGAFVQLRDLSQGVVDDSSLVRQTLDVSAGVGFVWSIWQSEKLDGNRWD
jgi:outer membrane scaffolding protein for murein synthesis (MipA/OmpV family)